LDLAESQQPGSVVQQANAQGQTVFSAAGDNGAADCEFPSQNPNGLAIVSATQGYRSTIRRAVPMLTGMGGSEFTGDGTAASPSTGAGQSGAPNGSGMNVLTSALSTFTEMPGTTPRSKSKMVRLSARGRPARVCMAKPAGKTA